METLLGIATMASIDIPYTHAHNICTCADVCVCIRNKIYPCVRKSNKYIYVWSRARIHTFSGSYSYLASFTEFRLDAINYVFAHTHTHVRIHISIAMRPDCVHPHIDREIDS